LSKCPNPTRMMWRSGGGTGLMGMVEMAAADLRPLKLWLILLLSIVLCLGFWWLVGVSQQVIRVMTSYGYVRIGETKANLMVGL
jgi:hypothetical protein